MFLNIPQKSLYYLVGSTLALLLIPLVAMQFTSEVSWKVNDFVVAGGLFLLFGGAMLAVRYSSISTVTKVLGFVAVIASLALIWAQLAVGVL